MAVRFVSPGFVAFSGDEATICQANLWLRTADRILIEVDAFECLDYEQLFTRVRAAAWESWMGPEDQFPVTAHVVGEHHRSAQAAIKTAKRAIVDRLREVHQATTLPETGNKYAVHVSLVNRHAWVTIDTTGKSLHRRGYRASYRHDEPKETLAAAMVLLSKWDRQRPLVDPRCRSGNIVIEAAMIACNMAPGRNRSFVAEQWPRVPATLWESARRQADEAQREDLPRRILGFDTDPGRLHDAQSAAIAAGVEDSTHFQAAEIKTFSSSREFGCLITTIPWVDEPGDHQATYDALPEVLRKLPTWSSFFLADHPDFQSIVGRNADRRRKLYHERRGCTLYSFFGPLPGQQCEAPFGQLTDKEYAQGELLQRRLVKRARHFRRWPAQLGISSLRLYERDIPEIPLVIDRYDSYLHITEYERPHQRDPATHANWLEMLARYAGEALEIPPANVILKRRQRQAGTQQYQRLAEENRETIVSEGGLQFIVNLTDYVDTGLFLDHRITRAMVRREAAAKRVVNLFAYTGSFSVYAAAGGAAEVTTVDWTHSYLQWAQRNMELNRFTGPQYRYVRSDAMEFLESLPQDELFDLAIVDPPTFSNSKRTTEIWEVQTGYAVLLNALLLRMSPGGLIYFSNNFRRFKLDPGLLAASQIHEISNQTIPPDFRNRRIHRAWRMVK